VTDTYKHETFDELKINRDLKSASCKLLYRFFNKMITETSSRIVKILSFPREDEKSGKRYTIRETVNALYLGIAGRFATVNVVLEQ